MLIDQFNNFLQEASKWPQSFWGHKIYSARKSFVLQLDEIKFSFKEKGSSAFKNIESLISVLNQDIDELRLAEAVQNLSSYFEQSGKKNKKIELFIRLSDKFLKRAQLFYNYQNKRAKLTSNAKQKKEFDQRLFVNEGTFYCLEYYLAIYKKLSELKTIKEKKQFIEAKEINLGFGNLSGLKEDFTKDEVLEKFILLVLDDVVREHLLICYYACKNSATSDKLDAIEFEKTLKKFLYYLLLSFQENKIEKLSSNFFKPYGDQPSVASLISIFELYES